MRGLLEVAPHFNYRDSMLKSMVPRMMSFDDEIRLVLAIKPFEVLRKMSQSQIKDFLTWIRVQQIGL